MPQPILGLASFQSSAELFQELVSKLRETEEWAYVEREIDIRLARRE